MNVYYFDTYGQDDTAILGGLKWLFKKCLENNTGGIIATVQKNSLENALINLGVDKKTVTTFLKNEKLIVGKTILNLMTNRNSLSKYHEGNLLVVHPDQKLLLKISEMSNITNTLVIPWNMEECRQWLEEKNASRLIIASTLNE